VYQQILNVLKTKWQITIDYNSKVARNVNNSSNSGAGLIPLTGAVPKP